MPRLRERSLHLFPNLFSSVRHQALVCDRITRHVSIPNRELMKFQQKL